LRTFPIRWNSSRNIRSAATMSAPAIPIGNIPVVSSPGGENATRVHLAVLHALAVPELYGSHLALGRHSLATPARAGGEGGGREADVTSPHDQAATILNLAALRARTATRLDMEKADAKLMAIQTECRRVRQIVRSKYVNGAKTADILGDLKAGTDEELCKNAAHSILSINFEPTRELVMNSIDENHANILRKYYDWADADHANILRKYYKWAAEWTSDRPPTVVLEAMPTCPVTPRASAAPRASVATSGAQEAAAADVDAREQAAKVARREAADVARRKAAEAAAEAAAVAEAGRCVC